MRRQFRVPMLLSGLTTPWLQSTVLANPAPDQCLNAADYRGCMEYHSGGTAGKVDVAQPSDHNYRPGSVRQQKIRGSYGRYLTFTGTTLNAYSGTPASYNPGSPGRRVCDTTMSFNGLTKTTSCRNVGYVAPSYTPGRPGGVERRSFSYQLDCKDRTFDRKGDFDGFGNKGWMNVGEDPTALAVANRYCPIIDSLPKPFDSDDDL